VSNLSEFITSLAISRTNVPLEVLNQTSSQIIGQQKEESNPTVDAESTCNPTAPPISEGTHYPKLSPSLTQW
jgi:hypothetical protein